MSSSYLTLPLRRRRRPRMPCRNWPSRLSMPKRPDEGGASREEDHFRTCAGNGAHLISFRAIGRGKNRCKFGARHCAQDAEDFIKEAATSDMLEIEAAKIAQQKGDDDEKKFADQMITDHTKTSAELKEMVPTDMKSAIPAGLDDTSQKKLDKLRDTKPGDFAGEYDPVQVSVHKDAVSLFERYARLRNRCRPFPDSSAAVKAT